MEPGDGFLSPPAAPQAGLSHPVLDLNGPKVLPSTEMAVEAPLNDENDQGNIFEAATTAVNGLASDNLSPEQDHNAPAGATDPSMRHPELNMKVCIYCRLRTSVYASFRSWVNVLLGKIFEFRRLSQSSTRQTTRTPLLALCNLSQILQISFL